MSTDLYAKETLQNLAQLKDLALEQLKAFTLALTNRLNNSTPTSIPPITSLSSEFKQALLRL